MKYEFENKFPLWHRHPHYVLKRGQRIINGKIVQTWPNNDGGYWYRDEKGRMVQVND